MQKNTSGQKLTLLVIDTSLNAPKTGDAANLTAYVSKDDGAVTVLGDTTATEKDATNAPGLYDFDLTQAETNADKLVFSGKSSTANVKVIPQLIYTTPASFSGFVTPTGAAVGSVTGAVGSVTGNVGGNVTGSIGSLATQAKADVNAEADTALSDYGALKPTTAGRTLDVTATGEAGIDWGNIGSPTTSQTLSGTTVGTATTLTNAPSDSSGVTTLLSRLTATRAGYLDNLSGGAVALASKLKRYIQLLARKDSAIATDASTELGEINENVSSGAGAYANTTDAQEALRDRGDAAWTTATGFSTLDASGVRSAVGLASANLDTQLDAIPTAAEITDSVWDETQSGHTTAGTFGKYLDAAVSGVSTGGVSAADIADAVWDEARVDHTTAGTFGQGAASVQGNVTGSVGSVTGNVGGNVTGSIGSLATQAKADVNAEADTALADVGVTTTITGRIDVATSTRLASASYTAPLDAAGVRTAVGLASANLDTQLSAIAGYIDTEVAAILTKIGTPSADLAADIAAIYAKVDTEVAAILAAVDTEVAAIKAKTDNLTFTSGTDLDVNVQQINDVTLTGDGSATPWGPA